MAWHIGKCNIKVDGHLFFPALVDYEARFPVRGGICDKLGTHKCNDDECADDGD